MARSLEQLLTQLERMAPGYYDSCRPLLAGFAAAMARSESTFDTLQPLATIGGGTGKWLTLQARGVGIKRGSGESDESLRARLRDVADAVTRPAIEAAVNALIAPDTCTIIEWWERPYLDYNGDDGCWLDNQDATLCDGPSGFLVLIPVQATEFAFGSFLDDETVDGLWLDIAFAGEGPEDPAYAAIVNEVERLRAAGIYWRLVIETEA